MVEVKNLTKYYADHLAVNNLNFSVNEGEILGFLGPNGAGKSTTMNIMTGYLSSTSGTVTIDGTEIFKDPKKTKAKIGYLPENPPLYLDMTVREYLYFVYDLKKVKFPKQEHIDQIASIVKIDEVYDRLIKNLSKGYKQRVGLAQALIGNPKLLILDEPTVGLDPTQIIEIRNLIKSLGESHTVILSSHVLSEVQAICERVIVINKGVLIADDTTENLVKQSTNKKQFIVTVDNTGLEEGVCEEILTLLSNMQFTTLAKQTETDSNNSYEFIVEAEEDIRRDIATTLTSAGFIMLGLKEADINLEDVFCELMEKPIEEKSDESIEDYIFGENQNLELGEQISSESENTEVEDNNTVMDTSEVLNNNSDEVPIEPTIDMGDDNKDKENESEAVD